MVIFTGDCTLYGKIYFTCGHIRDCTCSKKKNRFKINHCSKLIFEKYRYENILPGSHPGILKHSLESNATHTKKNNKNGFILLVKLDKLNRKRNIQIFQLDGKPITDEKRVN